MVRCRPITLGQSEPTRPDSTAHHRRQSAGLSPVETTVTSGLCEVGEFDRLTIAEMFLCDPGARSGAAGVFLHSDGGGGAHLRGVLHFRVIRDALEVWDGSQPILV